MFVTFEGVDGSGKIDAGAAAPRLARELGREVVATREPGGTELGEGIRRLVLDGPDMTPWAEAALFAASRAEHVERGDPAGARARRRRRLRPLRRLVARLPGDRARPRPRAACSSSTWPRRAGLLPDRTFVLAVDAGEAARGSAGQPDRIEREGDGFQREVDDGLPGAGGAASPSGRRARRDAAARRDRGGGP